MESITEQKTPGSAHLAATMAAVLGGGGVFGFVRRDSLASLVAGVTLGSAYWYGSRKIAAGEEKAGFTAALAASTALGGAMGVRFVNTGKLVPAGPLGLLGVGTATYYFKKLREEEES